MCPWELLKEEDQSEDRTNELHAVKKSIRLQGKASVDVHERTSAAVSTDNHHGVNRDGVHAGGDAEGGSLKIKISLRKPHTAGSDIVPKVESDGQMLSVGMEKRSDNLDSLEESSDRADCDDDMKE